MKADMTRGKSVPVLNNHETVGNRKIFDFTPSQFFKLLLSHGFRKSAPPEKEIQRLPLLDSFKLYSNMLKAGLNLLHVSSLPFLCVFFLYLSLKTQTQRAKFAFSFVLFYHLLRLKYDDNCQQSLLAPDNKLLGLHCKAGGKIFKIMKLMQSLKYEATPWLFTGHLSSIFCAVGFKHHPMTYFRNYYSFGEELIPVSWCLQSHVDPSGILVVCFPGIGGDVDSPYVRSLANLITKDRKWNCAIPCVLGFKQSTAEQVERVFQYDSNELMLSLLHQISQVWDGPIFLLGWSMGAIWVTALMNKYKDRLPSQVTGGIAFSGSFTNKFAMNPYYRTTYQPLICPSLALDFLQKYRSVLKQEDIDRLLYAQNYEELFAAFEGISGVPFMEFLNRTNAEAISNKPLLIISALDDPLHNPNDLGLEKMTHIENENIAFLMTHSGGHVAWPEGWFPRDFLWMRRITEEFIESTLEVVGEDEQSDWPSLADDYSRPIRRDSDE